MANLLIVDDEPGMRQLLTHVFGRGAGHAVRAAENGAKALELLRQEPADLIISDVKMPDMNGIELLRRVREFSPDVSVVLMTAFATVETAREAFKLGADDFIQKPFDVDELKLIVEKALERLRLLQENRAFRRAQRERGRLDQLIGHSQKMQAVYQMIETVAQVQSTVLITGESGTGKEMVARAIHNLSPRADTRVIVATNRDLAAMVKQGGFREDLFYRVSVIPIELPPLRERREDIPELVEHFVQKFCAQAGRRLGVSERSTELLERYSWPGNVRELEHTIERAVALERTDNIRPESLPQAITNYNPASVAPQESGL